SSYPSAAASAVAASSTIQPRPKQLRHKAGSIMIGICSLSGIVESYGLRLILDGLGRIELCHALEQRGHGTDALALALLHRELGADRDDLGGRSELDVEELCLILLDRDGCREQFVEEVEGLVVQPRPRLGVRLALHRVGIARLAQRL